MLARLVRPTRGRVALQEVLPGLPGGVREVKALEGERAVEPRLVRRVEKLDRLPGGLEGLREIRRQVEAARPHEVGRSEVTLQPRALRVLGRRRLERLDRAADVARDEIRDGQRPQGRRRGVARGTLADARDGGEHRRRLRIQALRGIARAQDHEAAVLESARDPRLDEAPRAHRLGQLGGERRSRPFGPRPPGLVDREDEARGGRQKSSEPERAPAGEGHGSRLRLLALLGEHEANGLGEHLVAGRARSQVLVHPRRLLAEEAPLGVGGDPSRVGMLASARHALRPRCHRSTPPCRSASPLT